MSVLSIFFCNSWQQSENVYCPKISNYYIIYYIIIYYTNGRQIAIRSEQRFFWVCLLFIYFRFIIIIITCSHYMPFFYSLNCFLLMSKGNFSPSPCLFVTLSDTGGLGGSERFFRHTQRFRLCWLCFKPCISTSAHS